MKIEGGIWYEETGGPGSVRHAAVRSGSVRHGWCGDQLLERLHETKIFPENSTDNQTIHASIGFALYEGESDFDALFQKADKALYEAKNTGKDKVCQFHL